MQEGGRAGIYKGCDDAAERAVSRLCAASSFSASLRTPISLSRGGPQAGSAIGTGAAESGV